MDDSFTFFKGLMAVIFAILAISWSDNELKIGTFLGHGEIG